MGSAIDKAKEVAGNVKDAVTGKSTDKEDNQAPVTNDELDNNPPGSANARERGVPQNAVLENKQSGRTEKVASKVGDSVEEPEYEGIMQTVPYRKPDPVREARKASRGTRRQLAFEDTVRKAADQSGFKLSPRAIGRLIEGMNTSDPNTANELRGILRGFGVDENQERMVTELLNNNSLFVGDQKPANLQVLALPPGAEKPREFFQAPGTTGKMDERYYPTRFPMKPNPDDYETGDVIYSVHEDKTFTVLSVAQQTPEFQASVSMPPMNPIERVEQDFEELPEEVLRSGLVRNTADDEEDEDNPKPKKNKK